MTKVQRMALRLSLALFAASATLLVGAWRQGPLPAPTVHAACSGCTGAWYGALAGYMGDAIANGIWPQTSANACGIENAIAMVNYDYRNNGRSDYFVDSSGQVTVANDNNNPGGGPAAASQWGYATDSQGHINQWAGYANIAPDGGTDPRSIAYMAWNYSMVNKFFHDYIYRWEFAHSSRNPAPPFSTQVLEATTKVGVALEAEAEPVSVAINGGMHSVIVSGLWSANDPMTNFPAQIQGIVYRDPEGDYSSSRQEIDYSVWAGGNYANQWGTYSLWSLYYGDRYSIGDHLNTFDPEPTVGPYQPNGYEHWFNGFTWIRLDHNYANGQWSPDWSFNAVDGTQMTTH